MIYLTKSDGTVYSTTQPLSHIDYHTHQEFDSIFYFTGNKIHYYKNRYRSIRSAKISDDEKIMVVLKAIPI